MTRIKIIGTGICIPEKVLTNQDLEKIVDTSDEWISERTGMKERHIAREKTAASDLAITASIHALKNAGIGPEMVDLVLVATATPDMIFPSTACFVQAGIGAKNAAAFDISAVCSGFVYALSVAQQYLTTGHYKTVLIVGTETFSKYLDWTDRRTCILFGDGAGAVVLTTTDKNSDNSNLFSTCIRSDGDFANLLCIPGGGSRNPIKEGRLNDNLNCIKMDGSKIFRLAVKKMIHVAKEILSQNNMEISDIDLVIPHQANFRIIRSVSESLSIPSNKIFINIEKYGNTSAASIPIAIFEADQSGKIKEGSIVLILAFGGGLTWGAALIKW